MPTKATKRVVGNRAIADFIHAWEKLTSNVARNAAELPPHVPMYAAPLLEVLAGLQEVEAAKQDRRAIKQQEVQESNELLRRGMELAEKLKSVLIGHHGPSSQKLVGYGIKPRRPRRSRSKGEAPQPGGPPSPEEKSASQAGKSSKPAEQAAEGKEVPQAAEQPKPEGPAPAPQSSPAPRES
jgi:hypothetical protein